MLLSHISSSLQVVSSDIIQFISTYKHHIYILCCFQLKHCYFVKLIVLIQFLNILWIFFKWCCSLVFDLIWWFVRFWGFLLVFVERVLFLFLKKKRTKKNEDKKYQQTNNSIHKETTQSYSSHQLKTNFVYVMPCWMKYIITILVIFLFSEKNWTISSSFSSPTQWTQTIM